MLGIGVYSLETWGEDQTVRYVEAIEDCCRTLADNPGLGRRCDDVRRGLRRMESGADSTLSFTARTLEEFWSLAFCINACFPRGTPWTTMTTNRKS